MKLLEYGINGGAQYIYNHQWALLNRANNKTGFDIFEDVTSWPKVLVTKILIADKLSNSSPKTYINNISTNMILRKNEKILLEHGRCFSYDPSQKMVKLNVLIFVHGALSLIKLFNS